MSPRAAALALYVVALALAGLRSGTAGAEAAAKQYYQGLPDFAADPPFKPFDEAASRALTGALGAATETRTPCPMARAAQDFPDVKGNICRAPEASRIREILAGVAPSLDPAKVALWKVDLDGDARPELLVAYSLASGGEPDGGDPYLAIWLLKPKVARYESLYAGTYLAGQVHAVTRFGPTKVKVLFVKSQSCTECHPRALLHAITFPDEGAPVAHFEFTYAKDHTAFEPGIEYARPGHGHSVDATIETRVPAPEQPATPHLIQLFRREGGKAEWWLFRCAGLRCDYERHADRLPGQHLRAWLRAERL
jgi:hypothetical protein